MNRAQMPLKIGIDGKGARTVRTGEGQLKDVMAAHVLVHVVPLSGHVGAVRALPHPAPRIQAARHLRLYDAWNSQTKPGEQVQRSSVRGNKTCLCYIS